MSTIVITGANRGIGLELCHQLADRGDAVIAACRSANDELRQPGITIVDGIDVADDNCGVLLQEAIGHQPVDVLINNAGILTSETLVDLDMNRMRKQYEVNALGPLRITKALLANLHNGAKIIILTSRVGSVGDNSSGGIYGYRMSKAAANMAGKNLAIELKDKDIAVGILHPGLVATGMTENVGVSTEHSVSGLIERINNLNINNTGTFWHAEGQILPW
ncbi:MAG: SDR family oxidoreductase [Gammaproteobacteria bacterium]|nr:SDR family oxidoreductase [Gammaproteobacteria bacterium]MCP4090732.1 SDR family oxidoreductase [Gammaproteobacteria bacterium]MCP4277159.1 SDR family oxidoreductase [Gammaproteobacteria bacterium]MCP4831707.1 SDR family oxidoreductase [Gammaproteobacteria bacterium]MCP4928031.1 SDR family oxidoreductase [Gammaproteobacteria bacterium]